MEFLTIGLICLSLVACVAICACAYFLAEQRKTEIQQAGIDRRAQAKLTTTETPYQKKEWYEHILENQEIMKIIAPYLPGLLEKFRPKAP